MILRSFLPLVTKSHVEQRILPTDPAHLFRIICDVDSYSQFLPLCSHSKVLKRARDGKSFQATLTVGIPPLLVETYVSHVTVDPNKLMVETKSIQSNILESLYSKWQLDHYDVTSKTTASTTPVTPSSSLPSSSASSACRVNFLVEMSVRDPIIAATLDHILQQVASQQVQAFAERCRQIPVETSTAKQ